VDSNDFISRHGRTTFRHSDELFAAIRSGACVLDHAPDGTESLPCSHFLRIYRIRAEHIRQFTSPHAVSLIADSDTLASELERSSDEPCGVWCFFLPPHHTFSVYEALPSQRVLGCVRAVDRRLVDDLTWERLWHDSTGNA
jgi:hypothetical protein